MVWQITQPRYRRGGVQSRGERTLQFVCLAVHVIISCLPYSRSLSFSFCVLYSIPKSGQDVTEINCERKEERMRPKLTQLHELPYNVWDSLQVKSTVAVVVSADILYCKHKNKYGLCSDIPKSRDAIFSY